MLDRALRRAVRLDRIHEPAVYAVATRALETGRFLGTDAGLFTTAYFHHADELRDEVAEAGFADPQVFNIEGPGFMVHDFPDRWADPERRAAILEVARLVETEPRLSGAASHLLAVATRGAT